ncbi:MAG: hypothetical protein IPL55_00360 [Saprospiraceae bacterium]|nr:hypothetical protein [Saprospiraceae bacterium]
MTTFKKIELKLDLSDSLFNIYKDSLSFKVDIDSIFYSSKIINSQFYFDSINPSNLGRKFEIRTYLNNKLFSSNEIKIDSNSIYYSLNDTIKRYNNRLIIKPSRAEAIKLKDTDNDGIPDINDLCPELRGSKANRGCPSIISKILSGNTFYVKFDIGTETDAWLNQNVDYMGLIKGGEEYRLHYVEKDSKLFIKGFNEKEGIVTSGNYDCDPRIYMINIWGHIFKFDDNGTLTLDGPALPGVKVQNKVGKIFFEKSDPIQLKYLTIFTNTKLSISSDYSLEVTLLNGLKIHEGEFDSNILNKRIYYNSKYENHEATAILKYENKVISTRSITLLNNTKHQL